MDDLPPLPDPLDWCYEWDGPYGTRKFSSASHNGNRPDRSVPIFKESHMRAYAAAAVAQERDCRTCKHYRDALTHAAYCVSVLRCVAGSSYQRNGRVQFWEAAPVDAGF